MEETVRQKTGLLIDPYFSSSKIAWILDNVDGARQKAEAGKLAFGTVDSWLIWNLTSGKKHVTDRTNASRTMLYNIVEDKWDADLLKLFNIPESMMPTVVWSSEKIGQVTTTLLASKPARSQASRAISNPLSLASCASTRRREEHLRHRLLPVAEHRQPVRSVGEEADHHPHLQPG
jgi:glycerol kinase